MAGRWTARDWARARERLARTRPAAPVPSTGQDGEPATSSPADSNAGAAADAVNAGPWWIGTDSDAPEPRHNARPEEDLQAAIVADLRPRLLPNVRILATNGDLPGGREQIRRAARRKRMGYTRGTPDLHLAGPAATGWLEVKVKGNRPTPEQLEFGAWAQSIGHRWQWVTSCEAAHAVAREWGLAV